MLGALLLVPGLLPACTGDNPNYMRGGAVDALGDLGRVDLGAPSADGGAPGNGDTSFPGYGGAGGEPGTGGDPGMGGDPATGGASGSGGSGGIGPVTGGAGGSDAPPLPTDGGTATDMVAASDQGMPPPGDANPPVDTGAPKPDVVAMPDTTPPFDVVTPPMDMAAADAAAPVLQRGLSGTYFSGRNFDTKVYTKVDQMIFFPWGSSGPGSGVPSDNFSIRWTGFIEARVTGTHTFRTENDDGVRVVINSVPVISAWEDQSGGNNSGQHYLTAGVRLPIEVEYYERAYTATMKLYWRVPGFAEEIIPSSALSTP